jgi:DNA-binding MarR family transcriptional regulator
LFFSPALGYGTGVVNDPIGEIQRAIIQFTRDSRSAAARSVAGGSFVAAAIMSYIASAADPTATGLAELWGLDKSTVSRQLADLEAERLVARAAHPTRARTQRLRLTAKGQRALANAIARHRDRIAEAVASWSAHDISQFAALLKRFVSG